MTTPTEPNEIARFTAPAREFLAAQRICRVATTGPKGPHVAPLCHVFDGDRTIYIETQPGKLTVRNLRHSPDVVVLVDHYEDDWAKLRMLSLTGQGRTLTAADGAEFEKAASQLYEVYPQFRAMNLEIKFVLAVDITGVRNVDGFA